MTIPAPTMRAEVGVVGGSGLYRFFDDSTEVIVDTPWGSASAPISVGHVGNRAVAFVPRHGADHEFPPHRVPYRANIWALHTLGVTSVFAPCASGSLQASVEPGHFVIPDQLIDQTLARERTFFEGPHTFHATFADPYDTHLRRHAVDACREAGVVVHDGGTVVTVNGPRFSTRAESRVVRIDGLDGGQHDPIA